MPYRKKYHKKRPRRRKKISKVMPFKGPLLKTLRSTLTYSDVLTKTSSGAFTSSQITSLNGLYDPDITNIGHQPRGFDQLMSLYDHYVVIGVRVEITAQNLSSTEPAILIVNVRDNSTSTGNVLDQMENPVRYVRQLGINSSGTSQKRITFNINPNSFLGRSKPLADSQLKGDASNNPTEGAYMHIGHVATDLTTSTSIALSYNIIYTAVFIEPKQVVIS